MKRQYQVILIDDDEDDQQIFSDTLKEVLPGVDFCGMSSSRELYSFFKTKTVPDLVFLDGSVPCEAEKNCLELIKEQKHLKKVPVIMYSGLNSENEIKNLYAKGAALFVNKPSSYRELIEILKTLLAIKWDAFSLEIAKNSFLKKFNAIKIPV